MPDGEPKPKPKRKRRTHSEEFKREAVKLLHEQQLSLAEAARNLGTEFPNFSGRGFRVGTIRESFWRGLAASVSPQGIAPAAAARPR